jgi:alpha-beta hydrolase superfamily lysophospholipase
MKHPLPARPSIGEHDGLSYALFLPEGDAQAGIVICHGAGSAKESHFDFARTARDRGVAALAYDARGHGRSSGELGPGLVGDALAMCDLMRGHAPAVALRGSSMGGFTAIMAAAASHGTVGAVAAICPAPADMLARALRSEEREISFRADVERLEPWLSSVSLVDAAASLGEAGVALLLMHARGDEQVPYTVSEELFAAASEPKRLLILPGGHHRSLQHDVEMQNEALRFVERALAGPGRRPL